MRYIVSISVCTSTYPVSSRCIRQILFSNKNSAIQYIVDQLAARKSLYTTLFSPTYGVYRYGSPFGNFVELRAFSISDYFRACRINPDFNRLKLQGNTSQLLIANTSWSLF